ncbi:MAG TPA: RNA-binding cell elongation regulator Jag/EloR [Acidimicrobiales bacterium]|jgi:spoIIIJ-associated protein|nr:RNA-binding cell elongation regulator Jag/EloR [Acidimicrobiales bacterium]|tara:strand:+ start:3341 stop:4270 length:930 start_codon:yes stop_codon:yes gene_type:complete
MEWIETTGSTVDEAKDRALDRLGIAEDDMQFEVIEEGSNSLFRLKRKEARLRARVKPLNTKPKFDRRPRNKKQGRSAKNNNAPEKVKNNKPSKNVKKDNPRENNKKNVNNNKTDKNAANTRKKRDTDIKSTKKGSSKTDSGARSRGKETVEKNKMNLEEQAEITEDFVSGLLERMDLQARVVSSIEDNRAVVQAQGLNLGLAIGPRGETVRAITQLAHTMIQRLSDGEAEGKLTVDIGGYRERRRTFLAEFAVNQANEVIEDGNSVALDPMNASDRKVVHDAVSDIEGVTTRSEGSDYDRHVVITVDET